MACPADRKRAVLAAAPENTSPVNEPAPDDFERCSNLGAVRLSETCSKNLAKRTASLHRNSWGSSSFLGCSCFYSRVEGGFECHSRAEPFGSGPR